MASGEHPSLDSEKLKLDPSFSEKENLKPLSVNVEQISKHCLTKDFCSLSLMASVETSIVLVSCSVGRELVPALQPASNCLIDGSQKNRSRS